MFLNCHTAFSFKYGTLTPGALFDEAKRCGIGKLILTEINNTTSYVEMLRLCAERRKEHALEIAIGVEFREGHELLYIALAQNNNGFQKINRFLSFHNAEQKSLPKRAPELEDVFFIYPFGKTEPERLRANEFLGVRRQDINRVAMRTSYAEFPGKFVVLHPVTFGNKIHFNVHRLLRAIDNNTLLSKLPVHQQAEPDEIMMPENDLRHYYEAYPGMLHNTARLLEECSINFNLGEDKNKKHTHGSEDADWKVLEEETWKGVKWRYPHGADIVLNERINRELDIIRSKNFTNYYLIAYDLIAFAKREGYDFVGRGSGANSVVAFCLGITNVDPIELNLYFERFLNAERTSPPDFDIDFSWDNRDAVYAYLFNKYGADHICLLGTHVTYQKRSVIRELGKVFGLPKDEIDALVDNPTRNKDRDHITKLIFQYAEHIKDLPSAISIHAGGVLITEEPIFNYTALQLPPKGLPVSHFDMHSAEDMGIYKFDILSQRGLGHLKDGVALVKKNKGLDIDIHRFEDFKKDEKIKDLLRNSKAMGCFYVESPAMRMLLGKLQCDDYLTLVAASSIIRPGVAQSGMMRAYIERFHLAKKGGRYKSIHPLMDELMSETYGVMVYQEDVIKVAHHFGKLTLTQADVLRRGMSGKFRSREEFRRVQEQFLINCKAEGYDQQVIDRVWFEIESFAGYSFAKGHSASYAVESYQSLFLKAHYPLEFMVGVINNFGGFYKTEFYFHEARMNGGKIECPCINTSAYLTSISGDHIFIGFVHLRSLNTTLAKQITVEREKNGPYKNVENFIQRLNPGLEQLRILIRIGAFRFTGKSKQILLWESMLFFSQAKSKIPVGNLFETDAKEHVLPELSRNDIEDAFDEIELIGFPLCDPFRLLQQSMYGDTLAKDLAKKTGQRVHIVGYVITTKDTRTMKKEPMHFGTFYDQDGIVFDTVHFPDSAFKYPFLGRGFYEIKGKVVDDFGISMIEVHYMDKLPMINKRIEQSLRENVLSDRAQHA